MSLRPSFTSTFAQVSLHDFAPLAQCDITHLPVLQTDLVPYMEWAGDSLYDTGLLVHKDFVDEPNPFGKTPPIYDDPTPVIPARPVTTFEDF